MSENRKLATIERIEKIEPIAGADRIELATVRGWRTVIKKGEFKEGDLCVFFEIDSFIPANDDTRPIFGFLDGNQGHDKTRVNDEGERGWALKTVRLKGQYSQGLALPLNTVFNDSWVRALDGDIGEDVTELLGIKVYEKPMNAAQRGMARGTRPHFVDRTDEPRLQNMKWALDKWAGMNWVATQKLDGSSMSVYRHEGSYGVTSRNMDLKMVPESKFWQVCNEKSLQSLLDFTYPDNRTVVLQGEVFGGSIQGNPLNVDLDFRAFNLVVDGVTLPRDEWPEEIMAISVPVYDLPFPKTLDEALEQADNVSTWIGAGTVEGIVWRVRDKSYDEGTRLSFKIISQKYLLTHDL